MVIASTLVTCLLASVCPPPLHTTTSVPVEILNYRFETETQQVLPLDGGQALVGGEVGNFRGEFVFWSELQNAAGRYIAPDLGVYWSILDETGAPVLLVDEPRFEWNGHQEPMPPLVITEFSPLTGEGRAGFSVPIGTSTELAVYPHLLTEPAGESAGIRLAFGDRRSLSLDELWQPRNVLWEGNVSFPVAWPEAWLTVAETPEEYDGIVLVELILSQPASADRLFVVECIGTGQVGSPVSEFLVAAGMWGCAFELKAERPGLYRLHATEVGGGVDVYSQVSEVLGVGMILKDSYNPEALGFNGDYYEAVEDQPWEGDEPWYKECRQARPGDPGKPVKFVGCTDCFEPENEDPLEPECGSTVKGLIHPAKCVPSEEWACELFFDPDDPTLECPKYTFAGLQVFPCGSFTARLQLSGQPFGVGAAGSSAWTTAKIRICCKYEYQTGETAPVKRKKCRNFL